MPARTTASERDAVVLVVLEGLKQSVSELRASVASLSAELDAVRFSELAAIRASVSRAAEELRADLAAMETALARAGAAAETALRDRFSPLDTKVEVLRHQARRSGAAYGALVSAVISVVVGTIATLLIRRP